MSIFSFEFVSLKIFFSLFLLSSLKYSITFSTLLYHTQLFHLKSRVIQECRPLEWDKESKRGRKKIERDISIFKNVSFRVGYPKINDSPKSGTERVVKWIEISSYGRTRTDWNRKLTSNHKLNCFTNDLTTRVKILILVEGGKIIPLVCSTQALCIKIRGYF